MNNSKHSSTFASSVLNLAGKGASIGLKGANALVSVVNIPVQQMNTSSNHSSVHKPTPVTPTRSASGFDIIGGLMSASKEPEIILEKSFANFGPLRDRSYESILEDLGLYDDEHELERLSLFFQFSKSCEASASSGGTTESEDRSDDDDARIMSLERFVIDLLKRGYEPQWCDAAFRSFSVGGFMNRFEYAIAVKSLEVSEIHMNNATWLELRRHLVFNYYDRSLEKRWSIENFADFVNDISLSKNERPEVFGIVDQLMINVPQLVAKTLSDGEENMDLIHSHAMCKLELAQKKSDYEELTLSYLKLEKQLCAMKLELARMKERLEIANVPFES